jgi:tetratricopeptide (TPR) repeat protein
MMKDATIPADVFDADRPLPWDVADRLIVERDAIAVAELAVDRAEQSGTREAQCDALMQLSDAWLAVGALAPSLSAARRALAAHPTSVAALERAAMLLTRAGAHSDAAELHEQRAALGVTSAWRAAAEGFVRAALWSRAMQCARVYAEQVTTDEAASFAVEVARAAGEPRAIIEQLELCAQRTSNEDEKRSLYGDLWIETRATRFGAQTALAIAQSDPAMARSVLVESLARGVQASRWDAAIDAARTLASMSDDPDERAAIAIVLALLQRSAPSREAARDALAEIGANESLAVELWADASAEQDDDLAAASWRGIAALVEGPDPARAIEALGRALARVPDDEDALAAIDRLREQYSREALDALAHACLASDERPKARGRLAALWSEREAQAGDAASAMLARERAAALGVTLAPAPQIEQDAEQAIARAREAIDAVERTHSAPASAELMIELIAKEPGAVDDVVRASRLLSLLAVQQEDAARAWLRLATRRDDIEGVRVALRRIATRGTSAAIRTHAAMRFGLDTSTDEPSKSESFELLELVLDEAQEQAAWIAATMLAIAARASDDRFVRSALRAMHASWSSGGASRGARLLARLLDTEKGDDAVASLFDDQSRLSERAAAWAQITPVLGESRSGLARWTRTLLASASDPALTLEVASRFARRAPNSAEAAFARFGAASMGSQLDTVSEATVGVLRSLAPAKDSAGLVRSAVSKLATSLGERAVLAIALEACTRIGLGDRALRSTLVTLTDRAEIDTPSARIIVEVALLSAESDGESAGLLRRLLKRAKADGNARDEARALRRLAAVSPGDRGVIVPWVQALRDASDGPGLLHALPSLLTTDIAPSERREALWMLAGAQRRLGFNDAAAHTLERIGAEFTAAQERADVARALETLGQHARANELLSHWGESEPEGPVAAAFLSRAALSERAHGAPAPRVFQLARSALLREPETPEALVLAEEVAKNAQLVSEMLDLYATLDQLAAGAHGRAALAYRRAVFLEQSGHADESLEAYFTAFDARPARGAVASAIARLAVGRRPDMLVALHRRLADGAATGHARVAHLLDAAHAAREQARDKAGALRLLLEAQDVLRDAKTTALVIEAAREIREESPELHRAAMTLIADRGIAVAEEVWDDDARRGHSLRAFEAAVIDLSDGPLAARAAQVFLRDSDNEERDVNALKQVLRAQPVANSVRAALREVSALRKRSSSATQAAVKPEASALETVRALATQGDVVAAIAAARAALSRGEDEALREYVESLARASGDAATELEMLDAVRQTTFDPSLNERRLLRSIELLRGPLARPDEAWRRLSRAINEGLRSDASLRVAHELAEQRQDWTAVSAVLDLRITRAEDRAEARALRLRRAAVLEQRLENPTAARTELEAIIEDEPSHRPALRYLADLHLRAERYADAGECYARAAAATHGRPEAAELLAAAGDAFAQGRDDGAAQAQFRRALELDPSNGRALTGVERVLRARGDLDGLERTLVALSNSAEHGADKVHLRLAAARAALDAGAIFRAKNHVDAVRAHAAPAEIAALDARLERARDDDRPISRSRVPVVVVAEGAVAPKASERPAPPQPTQSDATHVELGAVVQSELLEEPLLIEPLPPGAAEPAADQAATTLTASGRDLSGVEESALRAWFAEGDDEAGQELVSRFVRTEGGREEALRIQRDRFAKSSARLDILQSIEGLLSMLERHEHALAVRTVRETLSGIEPQGIAPPLNRTPDPPPYAVARWVMPPEAADYAEIGALLWDSLGTLFRREITGYGVTGVDRVMSAAPTEIARMYTAIARLLQMPRTAVFVRAQVPGGTQIARTQPPSVILASALSHDSPVSRYLLGSAMEGTRPSWVLTSLDGTERSVLVRALLATFGPHGKLQGEPPEVTRRARDLVAAIPPRAQKKIEELLAAMDERGAPFDEAGWVAASERARARAGLFASGDFAVAAQLVVVKQKGGGDADVPGSIGKLAALDDLARFAISDPYLRLRWETVGGRRRA